MLEKDRSKLMLTVQLLEAETKLAGYHLVRVVATVVVSVVVAIIINLIYRFTH